MTSEMAEGAISTNDAHRHEEQVLIDQPPSSSPRSLGRAIQGGVAHLTTGYAYDEEHNGAAPSTKLIPKANTDNMTHNDMDDPLKPTPVPKKNDTRDHSPSSDEHDNTQTGEPSTKRSTGVVRDGIPSSRVAELAKGTTPKSLGKVIQDGITAELAEGRAAAPSSMKSVSGVDPKKEENVNFLGGPLASMMSPTKAVPAYDQEHAGAASSTKIIPKANADAGPSVRAPTRHHEEVVAAIGGPAQANARDVASNAAPAIPVVAQDDVGIAAIGGGVVVGPAPAPINGGGIALVAARAAPVAIPVPVLPPNPGVNNIDPLRNSGIRPLRNPSDGDKGKIWDKLN